MDKPKEDESEVEPPTPEETPVQVNSSPPNAKAKFVIPPPFPGRLVNRQKEETEKDILDIFRKVEINIPLLDAIGQIPRYAKFLKSICTRKRKPETEGKICVSNNVSAVIQRKLPQKCNDPGMFAISCVIGTKLIKKAMLDLGASINVMPLSLFNELNIGNLKKNNVMIQLANRSIIHPEGVIEDVLVKCDKLIFPADFYVVDMGEELDPNAAVILLGRSFMKTAKTKIDVNLGTFTFEFDNEKVSFNVFDAMRYPEDSESMLSVSMVDTIVQDDFEHNFASDELDFVI